MIDTRKMTLRELHTRLGEIIAENTASGWDERNDALVAVRYQPCDTPTGRMRKSVYIPVAWAPSALCTIGAKSGEKVSFTAIDVYETAAY